MTELEANQRAQVIAIAKSLLGVPYRHQGRARGGLDCAGLPLRCYEDVGLIPQLQLPNYPADWASHRDEEMYLKIVETHAHKVDLPLPADLALFKVGRCLSHSALIINYPLAIHAWSLPAEHQVCWVDITKGRLSGNCPLDGKPRLRGFWRLNIWSC